ncbi:phage integrase SAM-like domain-containing protein [Photobacterium kasasachensis]|uniref:phage integrase SAM-like domain-containing protein n=1 Tax=Photobacterium kasasachensis TaxID=2910240 RepID=UPI003D11AB5F
MSKKKFTVPDSSTASSSSKGETANVRSLGDIPTVTKIVFPESRSNIRNYDFSSYYGKGFDAITTICQCTIEKLLEESISTKQASLSIATIVGYCSGLKHLFEFCILWRSGLDTDMCPKDINTLFIYKFIHYIKGFKDSPVSQRGYYTRCKSVLVASYNQGYLSDVDIKSIFPRNPFPNSNRQAKGKRALSPEEKKRLVIALKNEVTHMVAHERALTGYELGICVLAIGISTGMNPTPVLTLPIDCLQPHPIKANLRLLVAFKRRGNATHVVSLRQSQDVALLRSVNLNVASIIELTIERNAIVRARCDDKSRLLVYEGRNGEAKPLSNSDLKGVITKLIKTHDLLNDDGNPISLNMMRLRKTFVNRIWEMSGQDPLIAARHGKHTEQTANRHYWAPPPEAERNMRFLGEVRIKDLLEVKVSHLPKVNTPVSSCKDPMNGHLAPKNGTVCTELLGCFRCKSFVVTEDDLYRLFSFYWAVVQERDTFGVKRWKKYLRHIIRIIDNEIAPHFDQELIEHNRQKAKSFPHPFWRDLDMLRLAR